MNWIKVTDRTPIAYKSGSWDGLLSDLVLTKNADTGKYMIAQLYEGYLDGTHFKDWYSEDDYEVQTPTHWMELPE